ncbi:hypothetical protein B0T25DRAFT_529218 [Lasiosphaeria hispida]|uniref:Uncharacterized protein n=1 Tax=Lasiosphaeria hispida TaxID=260671 RepID=A0AAJ0HWU2_9PEZI|nr:hypothetical protein B0T25DRAFT_529218 [Lasiosphaeria hispida]
MRLSVDTDTFRHADIALTLTFISAASHVAFHSFRRILTWTRCRFWSIWTTYFILDGRTSHSLFRHAFFLSWFGTFFDFWSRAWSRDMTLVSGLVSTHDFGLGMVSTYGTNWSSLDMVSSRFDSTYDDTRHSFYMDFGSRHCLDDIRRYDMTFGLGTWSRRHDFGLLAMT